MSVEHHVIYVPGLNDQKKSYELAVNRWSVYGVAPHVYRIGWHDGESFKPKLQRLVNEVNKYINKGHKMSLVGGSAGGSAVLNALIEAPKINAVVNLCGRLRAGTNVHPSLEFASRKSTSFKESVMLFETREPEMSKEQRERVLNLIPIYDEIVPKSTVSLRGATNKTLYSVEHILSGLLGMTIFSPVIMKFIREKALIR